MFRLIHDHPHLWGWITAIVSAILPILSIVCWVRGNTAAAWLLAAPCVFIWPGITIRTLERAVAERKTEKSRSGAE